MALTTVDLNLLSANVLAAIANATPSGMVSFFAMSSAPSGWLKANGALVSRTTYAALFSSIGTTFGVGDGSTTFGLPDMRGQFPRGWADNGSVDAGRSFGSAQSGQNLAHRHNTAIDGVAGTSAAYQAQAGLTTYSTANGGYESYYARGIADSTEANASTSSTSGGAETRPVNVALLACIKY